MNKPIGWQKFINNCAGLSTTQELEQFFELVLTPSEREKIVARYQILAELIADQSTQREIAAKLNVSIFNVTRGANQLKVVSDISKQLINLSSD